MRILAGIPLSLPTEDIEQFVPFQHKGHATSRLFRKQFQTLNIFKRLKILKDNNGQI